MKQRRPFRVIPGTSGKKKLSRETFLYTLLLLAAGALVLHTAYNFARSALAGMLVNTVISEESILEQTIELRGVIVREEQVVAAPVTGTVHWVAPAGERLAAGARAAVITPENGSPQHIYTVAPGVVVPQLDGLEGVLQPASLHEVDIDAIRRAQQKIHGVPDGGEVRQGSMLFKVVNNYSWFYLTELSADVLRLLGERNTALLRFAFAPEIEVLANWTVVAEDEGGVHVAFEIKDEISGSFTERLADAELITARTRGFVLPASALVERGEDTGVFIVDKAVVRYRRVTVRKSEGNMVVVEGIPEGFTVITNPFLVREGQRL